MGAKMYIYTDQKRISPKFLASTYSLLISLTINTQEHQRKEDFASSLLLKASFGWRNNLFRTKSCKDKKINQLQQHQTTQQMNTMSADILRTVVKAYQAKRR